MSGKNYDFARFFKGNAKKEDNFNLKGNKQTKKVDVQKPRKMNASRTSN